MARARNPKRDEAMQIYLDALGQIKIKDIAAQIEIPDSRVRKWKTEDKWDEVLKERSDSAKGALLLNMGSEKEQLGEKRKKGGQPGNGNARGHGAPLGNKNAAGNKGGAPPRNTNGLKTGEFQTLWLDYLSDEERLAYEGIDVDKISQIDHDIRILTWRENKMLERIFELREGVDNIETETVSEAVTKATQMEDGTTTIVRDMRVKEVKTKQKSMLGEILRIEEALTRVQDKKAKFLQAKNKIELDRERMDLEYKKINKDDDYEKITKVLHEVLGGTKHNLDGVSR